MHTATVQPLGTDGDTTMSEEHLVVMYKNGAGQTLNFRVALQMNGAVWQAAIGWEAAVGMGEEVRHFSGTGAGPDVFALGRELTEHEAAARKRDVAGFTVLQGGRAGTG
jgi:shikimate kinase